MVDRSTAPSAGTLSPPNFTDYKVVDFLGKRDLLLLEDRDHPLVCVDLIFEGGRMTEQDLGTSWFATKMVLEGTNSHSADQISTSIESLGSYIELKPGMDYSIIRLYSIKKNAEATLQILEDCLLGASYPEEEFELLKKIRFQNISSQMARNSALASWKFNEALFGSTHPYGTIITPEAVLEVKLEKVREYANNLMYLNPKVVVAGDFNEQLLINIKRILEQLPISRRNNESREISGSTGRIHIEKENSNQASIRLGSFTLDKSHPDFHKLNISNEMLGGFFGSRLMKSIREEKGLTYGIYSSINELKTSSIWQINAEVEKSKMEVAIEEVYNQIKKIQDTPPTSDEMKILQNYLTGKMQSSFDSLFAVMYQYKALFLSDLDLQHLQTLVHQLKTIKPEEISETLTKHINADNMLEVLVS